MVLFLFLVRWSLSGLLFLLFIYHLSSSAIIPFTCNFVWFIKLRVSAGICGVCLGVFGCARVCAGVLRVCADVCTGVSGYAWVYMDVSMGVCGYMEVYPGILGCTWVYAGVRVFVDMHGCMHVCGMNFQNFFWRLES